MARKYGSWSARMGARLAAAADAIAPPEVATDRARGFANDPVGFAREVLGLTLSKRQRQIITAVHTNQKVAVVSGHKVGKSTSLAVLALWFYCSFPGARVVITATTDRQVNGIIWREIKRLLRNARLPIPGAKDVKVRASSGLDDEITLAEIRGYTAKEAEAIAGVSGPYILYIVDEASGVDNSIFEAIEGNRAAGNAWVFMISNPTRADGEFFDAFHGKAKQWCTFQIDSRESPNCTGEWRELDEWDSVNGVWKPRTETIKGMADPGWVAQKLLDWGEDDPLFCMRVAGKFSIAENAKIFKIALIAEATARWEETEAAGRLQIGVDPAGDGDGGDESAFCARRGNRVLELRARAGMSPAAHIAEIQDIILANPAPGLPLVTCESEGEAGWKVYCALRDHAQTTGEFDLARVRTSSRAIRQPHLYDRIRDEMYAAARDWVRKGGAFPAHAKLEKDLHIGEFTSDIQGRLKLTPKREMKVLLGRSPDCGDAFVISVWEPLAARVDEAAREREAAAVQPQAASVYDDISRELDPYSALNIWRRE